MGRLCVLVLVLSAVMLPGSARAGGDLADLAVGPDRAWLTTDDGLRSVDLPAGHLVAGPTPTPGLPISVALAGGATWIATIENGYVDGRLVRIDARSGRARLLWHRADSSVQAVAAGAGSVWALIGSRHGMRVARFSLDGRLLRIRSVPGAGRIAADAEGCWISAAGWLLRIDPAGALHRVRRGSFGVSTGAGAVWLPGATSILRLDERTGAVRRIRTGRLPLGGFQHEIAANGSSVFVLRRRPLEPGRSALVRFDARTGATRASVSLPGIGDAVVLRGAAVWVVAVLPPAGGSASGYALLRYDASTLDRTLRIVVP